MQGLHGLQNAQLWHCLPNMLLTSHILGWLKAIHPVAKIIHRHGFGARKGKNDYRELVAGNEGFKASAAQMAEIRNPES